MVGSSTDVFVCGGGPAGLAAAIASRQAGFRTVLADPSRPPIDKACGEGLMPDSLAALAQLGVTVPVDESFPFQGIRFWGEQSNVSARFPSGAGLGVRRTVLHRLLVDRAERAGVELLWGARTTGIAPNAVLLDGRRIHTRWIVGADGQGSQVRRWAGLDRFHRNSCRYGFRRHFRLAPWTDHMEIYWAEGCQIYVTPVSDREVCVVVLSRDSHLRLDHVLPRFPKLLPHLRQAATQEPERGAISPTRTLRRVTRGQVALIGDASGSVDSITGEGMCLAFQQAVELAAALESGGLSQYEKQHARLLRRPTRMADFMLLLDRIPLLRERALRALSAQPGVFAGILATHVGESGFPLGGLLRLGIEMVRA